MRFEIIEVVWCVFGIVKVDDDFILKYCVLENMYW